MTTYSRPEIAEQVFRDATGEVIRYGDRWGAESAPDDAYRVTSNLERYLPLHTVADALIAHLVEIFDVTVRDDSTFATALMHTREDVIRAVRLTPSCHDGAPLTFVFTSFPSVIVVAGAVTQLLFPFCGCDACDEPWEYSADEMEWQVFAVADGGLSERQTKKNPPGFVSRLAATDGSAFTGEGDVMTGLASPERLGAASAMLAARPHEWKAWVRRS